MGSTEDLKLCKLRKSTKSSRFWGFFGLFIYLFLIIFLAALGLPCCMRVFSSCGGRGLLFVVVRGLLIAVASLVAEHRLQMRRLSNCGARA